MMTVTSNDIPGMTITESKGLVYGNSVRARNIGRDITATFRNIVGGEVTEYAQLLAQSREEALRRMEARAEVLGANAIVALRFSTSMVMSGAAELLAYGTAVVVENAD